MRTTTPWTPLVVLVAALLALAVIVPMLWSGPDVDRRDRPLTGPHAIPTGRDHVADEGAMRRPEPIPSDEPATHRVARSEAIDRLGTPMTGDADDLLPDRPYRLRAEGDAVVERVSIDHGRDGTWDERIAARDGAIVRESAPGGDGRFTERHVWRAGEWAAEAR